MTITQVSVNFGVIRTKNGTFIVNDPKVTPV